MLLEIQPQYPHNGQGVRENGPNLGKVDRDLFVLNSLVFCFEMDFYKGIYLLLQLNFVKFLPVSTFFRVGGVLFGGDSSRIGLPVPQNEVFFCIYWLRFAGS